MNLDEANGPQGRRARSRAAALSFWLIPCVSLVGPGLAWAAPPIDESESSDEAEGESSETDAPETQARAPGDPQPEEPEPKPQTAVEWFYYGVELSKTGDKLEAAEAFMTSYELSPSPEALYNAALAYQKGARPLAAIDAYERHLADPKAKPERRAKSEAAIDELTRAISVIKIRPPEGVFSKLKVDGVAHTLDEFPLRVMPGEIELVAVAEDGAEGRQTYELSGGAALIVDLDALMPAPPEPPALAIVPPALGDEVDHERRFEKLRVGFWIGAGVTGASLVGALIPAALALDLQRQNQEIAEACAEGCPPLADPGPPEPGQVERIHALFPEYKLGANIMWGVTGAFAVATVVVGVLALRERRAKERRASERQTPGPQVRVSPGGLIVEF